MCRFGAFIIQVNPKGVIGCRNLEGGWIESIQEERETSGGVKRFNNQSPSTDFPMDSAVTPHGLACIKWRSTETASAVDLYVCLNSRCSAVVKTPTPSPQQMSSPLYLERGHALVGGHPFSPLPQKRILGDTLMQESRILPCDRDAHIGSSFTRKMKDVESTLTSSYVETDSVISSCMLTSESFYGQTETPIHRCGANSNNESFLLEGVEEAAGETLPQPKPDKVPVNDLSPPRLRKHNVNWGDRNSIGFSIEYPKSMAAELTPKVIEKVKTLSYFKICFGTEFSDDDDEDESDDQSLEERNTANAATKNNGNGLTSSMTSLSIVTPKKSLVRVCFLSAATSKLIGVIETEDGMLSPRSLANLSLPQIQLIVNDLLNQISEKNLELMKELPIRDDLNLEKEEKKAYLDRCVMQYRASSHHSAEPYHISPLRPNNLAFADAFNPNPEYRYPFNLPPLRASFDSSHCVIPKAEIPTTTLTTVGARLKTCITRFFGSRRSHQPQPSSCIDASLKSLSF
ncbi:schwannomin interacting protein 1 [Echinococcus multilocularis]|uniref:Schwannomin interacting protein 1 n=1 Tax=Echinococcus multilocularis TaxID=6211 RepID=A0A068Y2B8_ECHMU|nr:schwannomin interacting protein 1 [Echinococcus multilocularis]